MNEYWYPCAFSHWGEEEYDAIKRVTKSGRFTMGPEVEAFEEEFARFHGMKHGVMVNSGSSANLIAVAALCAHDDFEEGKEADVPAIAWATTYAPLVQYGFNLRILDCDGTWNVSGPLNGSDLLIDVPVLGNATRNELIGSGTYAYQIQDCCESLGARDADGHLCGTQYDMSTFSFYHSHQISAIEGGMILTNDDELNALCRMLRDHGMTRWQKPKTFDDEYDFRLMGYNVRPVEMHAAIAREQLKKLPRMIENRVAKPTVV